MLQKGSIKRKRKIYSCESCRSRKLKCDKARPSCSTCLKHNLTCKYIFSSLTQSKSTISSKIIDHQQNLLYNNTPESQPTTDDEGHEVTFSQITLLFSLIRNNRFTRAITINSRSSSAIPKLVEEELAREKERDVNLEGIRSSLRQNIDLFSLLIPYFSNPTLVWELVHHFFNTELYLNFSFVNKESFFQSLIDLLGTSSTPVPLNITKKPDLVFIGQLLCVLRVSSTSFYNAGYGKVPIYYNDMGHEALNFAKLILEEVQLHSFQGGLECIKLMLMLNITCYYSPNFVGWNSRPELYDVSRIVQVALVSKCNIEPKESLECDFIRRIWAHIMDLDYVNFIYEAAPIFISEDLYTTLPPRGNDTSEFAKIINEHLGKRIEMKCLISDLYRLTLRVRNPPKLKEFELIMDRLCEYQKTSSLDSIMRLDSSTTENRMKKLSKFLEFLDVSCLSVMITNRVYLYYDNNDELSPDGYKRSLKSLIVLLSSISPLVYFLDSQQQHYFNLRNHFGYSIQLVTKIIQCLHRVFQLQLSLLIRVCYHSTILADPRLEELKRILFQNSKVIVSSIGKVSDTYIYAKRIYIVHSYIVFEGFGKNCQMSQRYINALREDGQIKHWGFDFYDIILSNLLELSGDREITDKPYQEPLNNYLEELINNTTDVLGTDAFTIEALERFLKSNSFLED